MEQPRGPKTWGTCEVCGKQIYSRSSILNLGTMRRRHVVHREGRAAGSRSAAPSAVRSISGRYREA